MSTERDWDGAHRAVAEAYFPHELTGLDGSEELDLSLRTVELGPVTIGRLSWGADVSIACEYPGAYEVNIPLSGRLHSTGEAGEIVSVPGTATVFAAGRASLISRWTADCEVLGVKFDADHLEREAERIHARPAAGRLSLPAQVDVADPAGKSWVSLIEALTARRCEPGEPSDVLANPLVGPQIASAVTVAFLLAVDPEPVDATRALRPRTVKRVLDAIEADPTRAWTLAEMAGLAQTSVRRLQEAFAEYVGASPTATLRDIRLARAHADIEAGVATVSDVAARWGFSSASRFAAAYRRRYGQSPSQARRR
ncbi:AraC family transcriptional regulator [Gordonia sp. NB41Y]|uniref:AraC family transcriptional regulator n=1 Tax=Gordonia sp. NB41Y TaxID=875808 RepID=UPI0006B190B3|nr:AraC family transcriptional regulator [Gordonia sp. NB41Y]KOY49037.1 AraC family transcriptional regulator [Gordonia sp. NB41Y]WLP89989.1 AraC family transcriptional regulator [Gordonia sp. NB41Y]